MSSIQKAQVVSTPDWHVPLVMTPRVAELRADLPKSIDEAFSRWGIRCLRAERFQYFEHQMEHAAIAIEAGCDALVQLPTNSGKTYSSMIIAAEAISRGKKAIIVTYDTGVRRQTGRVARDLMELTGETLGLRGFDDVDFSSRAIAEIDGHVPAKKRNEMYRDAMLRLLIGTPETLLNDIENNEIGLDLRDFEVIQLDEIHHTGEGELPSYQRLFAYAGEAGLRRFGHSAHLEKNDPRVTRMKHRLQLDFVHKPEAPENIVYRETQKLRLPTRLQVPADLLVEAIHSVAHDIGVALEGLEIPTEHRLLRVKRKELKDNLRKASKGAKGRFEPSAIGKFLALQDGVHEFLDILREETGEPKRNGKGKSEQNESYQLRSLLPEYEYTCRLWVNLTNYGRYMFLRTAMDRHLKLMYEPGEANGYEARMYRSRGAVREAVSLLCDGTPFEDVESYRSREQFARAAFGVKGGTPEEMDQALYRGLFDCLVASPELDHPLEVPILNLLNGDSRILGKGNVIVRLRERLHVRFLAERINRRSMAYGATCLMGIGNGFSEKRFLRNLEQFANQEAVGWKQTRVLVSTKVISEGHHIPKASHIFIADIPTDAGELRQLSGRVGRDGGAGFVNFLVTLGSQGEKRLWGLLSAEGTSCREVLETPQLPVVNRKAERPSGGLPPLRLSLPDSLRPAETANIFEQRDVQYEDILPEVEIEEASFDNTNPRHTDIVTAVQNAYGLRSPLAAAILIGRGNHYDPQLDQFLSAPLELLESFPLLPNSLPAFERLHQAMRSGDTVGMIHDFDVDGMTSVAIKVRMCRALGIPTYAVAPNRIFDGFGAKAIHIPELSKHRAKLVMSLDIGYPDEGTYSTARAFGMHDWIALDHHHVSEEKPIPEGVTFVSPLLSGHDSAFQNYCTGGVAYRFADGFTRYLLDEGNAEERAKALAIREGPLHSDYLQLAALASIADVMPSSGASRILVRHGIEAVRRAPLSCLRAIAEESRFPIEDMQVSDGAFRVAPTLNAAGRMEGSGGNIGRDLLSSDDPDEIGALATRCRRLNDSRKVRQARDLRHVTETLKRDGLYGPAVVVSSRQVHLGIAGTVAGECTENFGLPSFIAGYDQKGRARGSARRGNTLPHFHLAQGLEEEVSDLCVSLGGHAAAAGYTLHKGREAEFARRVSARCERELNNRKQVIRVKPDIKLHLATLIRRREEFLAGQNELSPFGPHFESPIYRVDNVQVSSRRSINDKHMMIQLATRDPQTGERVAAFAYVWKHYRAVFDPVSMSEEEQARLFFRKVARLSTDLEKRYTAALRIAPRIEGSRGPEGGVGFELVAITERKTTNP